MTRDAQGVKDTQLLAAEGQCTVAGGVSTCRSPGLLAGPSASNPETNAVGQTGCTERLVTKNVDVSQTAAFNNSWEIHVRGINFGGQVTDTPLFKLSR